MSMTFPGPVSRQHNRDKSSAPLLQNQYHSKSHPTPDKCGASAKGIPQTENHQAPQVSQDKKNGKKIPFLDLLDSSYLSIAAAVLWPLLIKNLVFSRLKIGLNHREYLEIPSMR